jgi:hypothetical protein
MCGCALNGSLASTPARSISLAKPDTVNGASGPHFFRWCLRCGLACAMLEYVMRLKHPFPYDSDPTVRLGQQIGDAIFLILLILFVWGVFWPLLQRFL